MINTDIESMALVGWREARGDGLYACYLVMHVVFNRVGTAGFPSTIQEIIYAPEQFSSMDPGDPQVNTYPALGDEIYKACLIESADILAGATADGTHGALYYANEDNVTSHWYIDNIMQNPAHPITLKYGHHTFRR